MNNKQQIIAYEGEHYFSPLELIDTILNGKRKILIIVTLTLISASLYSFGKARVYKADTIIRVESQKASIPGLDELTGLNSSETSVSTEIEILKSRKNLGKAIQPLKLDILAQPKKIPLLSNLYRRFFSNEDVKKLPFIWEAFDKFIVQYALGNEVIKVDRLDVPDDWFNKNFILKIIDDDFQYEVIFNDKPVFKGKLGVTVKSTDESFVIFVSQLTGLPGTEFEVLKLSKRRAISQLKDSIKAKERGKNTGIIELSAIGKKEKVLIKILDQITKTYIEHNKSRSAEEASNALIFLEEQIKPVKEKVDKAEANLRFYKIENKTTNLPLETQSILDLIVNIDSELQKLALAKEELLLKYTSQHPTILATIAQVKQLKDQKELTQKKISILPNSQQELFELERDIQVSNSIYINLLNQIQEFKIAKASSVGNAYVIDSADIDDTFIKPNLKWILVIGGLLGLLLGGILVFLKKALYRTISSPEQLEIETDIPIYATILLSKKVNNSYSFKTKRSKQKTLLALDNKSDPAIEGLRSLRTSLHFALHQSKNNVVMITSASPSVGKTFISSNFAAVLADTGQRVVLIDADMRQGYLHELFKLKNTHGLSDIISLNASVDDVINTVQVGEASLDVITLGQTPPNPSELLMNKYFKKLLVYLSSVYDVVLIDTPPVANVTDSAIIGSHAGVVFMVVNPQYNSIKQINGAVKQLSNIGIDTKGFIYNGYIPKSKRFGYESYYGEYT